MRFRRWEGRTIRVVAAWSLAAACVIASQQPSVATQSCDSTPDVTVCIAVAEGPLSGFAKIEVTKDPIGGPLQVTWAPGGGGEKILISRFGPDPRTLTYSFVWPTHKYLDASGTLRAVVEREGVSAATFVRIENGNLTGIDREPTDWRSFLPERWKKPSPPIVAAVGDGPDGRPDANAVARSIVTRDPALFLFLGDIYESGTHAEIWNYFGRPSFDGRRGTLWGRLASLTQPTLGDHEAKNLDAWRDYFRGRPRFSTFRFGGVLFLNLDSQAPFKEGSKQYELAERQLAQAPPCVVAYWHTPAIVNGEERGEEMWTLLADGGGDLLLSGNIHTMAEYHPLTADLELGGHLVQLIAGTGGHFASDAISDPEGRIAWSLGKTPGAVFLTLKGAEDGGQARSISWRFRDVEGNVLRTGSVSCGR